MKTLALMVGITASVTAVALAPLAVGSDMLFGNYDLHIARGSDFHTWVWVVRPCDTADCVHVNAVQRPNAGNVSYAGDAHLVDGRYTLIVDVGQGLFCGGYFGSTVPTRDTYSWDAVTLAGSVDSAFATGCDGSPGGSYTYPFELTRT